MKLKPPSLTGTTSQTGDNLQRRVSERVTERWEKEARKKRHAATVGKVKSLFAFLIVCGIAGGAFYMWRSGMMETFFGVSSESPDNSAPVSENGRIESMLKEIRVENSKSVSPKMIRSKERDRALDQHLAFAESLKSVKIDYWKNAPDQDRPGKSSTPLEFRGVIADGKNGMPIFLELTTAPNQPMKIKKISASVGTVELTQQDFNRLTSNEPYLIIRDDRAYLSIPKKRQKIESYPVPMETDEFNPSKAEFGNLYELILKLNMALPDFHYAVYFENDRGDAINVATLGYGATVTSDMIAKRVADYYKIDSVDGAFIKALMSKGRLRFKSVKAQKSVQE